MKRCHSILLLFTALLLLNACANKVTPLGGDKDVKPPVVLEAIPENGRLQFDKSEIVITFDEYIQLKDAAKQIVVSPLMDPAPEITVRKKSVVIALAAPLRSNTTYVISFGNAITDLHEGNILPAFRYVFSTGSYIDSLAVTGTLSDALTGKPVEGAVAMLYKIPVADSLPLRSAPDYFAKSDASGKFIISNIAAGSYRMYGLDDKNSNFRLDPSDEKAGFLNNEIHLPDSQQVRLLLTKQWPAIQAVRSAAIQEPGKLTTVFARPLGNPLPVLYLPSGVSIKTEYNTALDSATIYIDPQFKDSVQIIWYDGKTLIDTVSYRMGRGTTVNHRLLTGTPFPQRGNPLPAEAKPNIFWNHPVLKTDTTLISMTRDSVRIPVEITFENELQTKMSFSNTGVEGNYNIVLFPGAVTDQFTRTNDTLKIAFSVAPARGKGTITYHLNTVSTEKYILQLINDKDEVVRSRRAGTEFSGTFPALEPGIYSLRIIDDKNNNNSWDSGDALQLRSPETVIFYPEKITVRANWDVDIDWNVITP